MVCGVGAPIELLDPTMTVRVNGATEVAPLTDNSAPAGAEAKVSGTVCGSSAPEACRRHGRKPDHCPDKG
jgi:hypothetical protein